MARKFSRKDNPIFQRLEIPQPRTFDTTIVTDNTEEQSRLASGSESTAETIDSHYLTLKNRPSKTDPQKSQREAPQEVEQLLKQNFLNEEGIITEPLAESLSA